VTAGDVYRALWRHKWLILALTALCVAGTWYVTSLVTKTYKASTLVRVQQRGAGNSFNALDASVSIAQTYAEIIDSGAITDPARTLVKGRIRSSLVDDVKLSAKPVPDLSLIWISAKGEHPVGVAALANASPTALRNAARKYGTPGDQIVTVTRAGTPSAAISPDKTLNIALALALGLLLNCGLVLIYEVLRDRLPETSEFEEVLGYPVLASIPTLRLKALATVGESAPDRYERKPELISQPGPGDGRADDRDAPT
jgi:capsular polysaccharide biosynthesis protein